MSEPEVGYLMCWRGGGAGCRGAAPPVNLPWISIQTWKGHRDPQSSTTWSPWIWGRVTGVHGSSILYLNSSHMWKYIFWSEIHKVWEGTNFVLNCMNPCREFQFKIEKVTKTHEVSLREVHGPGGKSDCVAAGPAVPCHRGPWISYSIPKFLACPEVY
jgi:hypothetical protein